MSKDATDPARTLRTMLESEASPSARAIESRRQAEALVATLHADELVMLRHITSGWSKAESAAHLGVDMHQFEKRRAGLFRKLNAGSTADVVRVGIYAGLG